MRVTCKFCGKTFSAAQIKMQLPLVSHFLGPCEKGREFIEKDLFPSLLIIQEDEAPPTQSTT